MLARLSDAFNRCRLAKDLPKESVVLSPPEGIPPNPTQEVVAPQMLSEFMKQIREEIRMCKK